MDKIIKIAKIITYIYYFYVVFVAITMIFEREVFKLLGTDDFFFIGPISVFIFSIFEIFIARKAKSKLAFVFSILITIVTAIAGVIVISMLAGLSALHG